MGYYFDRALHYCVFLPVAFVGNVCTTIMIRIDEHNDRRASRAV